MSASNSTCCFSSQSSVMSSAWSSATKEPKTLSSVFAPTPREKASGLARFVDAVFEDFILNTPDGAAFVLRALPERKIAAPAAGTVEAMIRAMSASAFGELLRQKTEEELERRIGYQAAAPASAR